jgi:ribose transport system substrate-binding protein
MRAILLSLILFCALVLTVAVARAETIGVVLPGAALVFYQAMFKGIERAAEEEHVQLLIRTPSDGAYLDVPNLQLHIIDYLVNHGVSGIVLAPEPLQREAKVTLSVPVVLVDRDSAIFNNISTVDTDNFDAGRRAALSLVPVLQTSTQRPHVKMGS